MSSDLKTSLSGLASVEAVSLLSPSSRAAPARVPLLRSLSLALMLGMAASLTEHLHAQSATRPVSASGAGSPVLDQLQADLEAQRRALQDLQARTPAQMGARKARMYRLEKQVRLLQADLDALRQADERASAEERARLSAASDAVSAAQGRVDQERQRLAAAAAERSRLVEQAEKLRQEQEARRQAEAAKPVIPPGTEKRVALVMGNARYADRPLRNPVNDSALMARTLQALGFEVQVANDVDRQGMLTALRDFQSRSRDADVALFYFAGHGAQVGGTNYLIPLNASIRSETDVPDEAIDAVSVLHRIEEGRALVGLVILDACRDNPYPGANRSTTRGLSRMNVPAGTIVAYATAPGSTAEDGTGDNSTYTAALARHLATPGLDIKEIFDRTAQEVERVTNGRQRPREEVALRGRLVLHDRSVITTAAVLSSPGASNGTQISDDLERERVRERMERERIAREQIDWMGERRRLEEWRYWQLQMQKDYDRIASLRGSEHLRAWSWERFLSFWSIDNPLSSDDEDLRRMAQEEIRRLRLQEATPWNDAKRDSLEPPPNFQNAGKPGYHTVRSGESLAQIAISYGTNWRDIARWNQLEDTDRLVVGQVLRVVAPQSSGTSQNPPVPTAQVTGTKLDRQNLESSGSASAATVQPNVNDAVRMARDREAALRVFAQGVPAGTGTGAGPGRGHATVFAAPSDAYAALLLAALRPNILFTERHASGSATEVEVTAESDGRISGRRIIRSSGHRGWDDAVLRAIDRTRELPRDIDGSVPPKVVIVFRSGH